MLQSLVEDMLFPLSGRGERERAVVVFRHVFIENHGAQYTILYAHGNAVTLSQILPALQDLAHTVGCNVFAFEYPGYDTCAGTCTPQTLNLAVKRAHEAVIARYSAPECVILMGRSIGCAPILWLAEQLDHIHGVILMSAFTSVRDMILTYPACGLQYLVCAFVDEVYSNETAIRNIHCPVLIMHGQLDDVAPVRMAEQLYFACPSVYKRLYLAPDGDHVRGIWCLPEIDLFIEGL